MSEEHIIDLDAIRAERARTAGPPKQIKIGGKLIALPSEVPFSVLGFAAGTQRGNLGNTIDMFKAIFGDAYEHVMSLNLSMDDVRSIVQAIFKLYDLGPDEVGNGQASTQLSNASTTN